MVQGQVNCTVKYDNPKSRNITTRPVTHSKYSTVNYVSTHHSKAIENTIDRCECIPNEDIPILVQRSKHCRQKTYWEKCTTSSCLTSLMKFIQHQCSAKKKTGFYCQPVTVTQDTVVNSVKQLKCDLNRIIELENNNRTSFIGRQCGGSARNILTRMACNIYIIENKLTDTNSIQTCGEFMPKRRLVLNIIKTIQKLIGTYIECEVESTKDKQTKLCNLLKYLRCLENEFRSVTQGIKVQCCTPTQAVVNKCSTHSRLNSEKTKSATPRTSYSELKKRCSEHSTMMNSKNYEITGLDVVYTKSSVKKIDSTLSYENNENAEDIDKKIACHIPVSGEPICQLKVCDGHEELRLVDSQPLKETLCQISNLWYESAKQLIDAFTTC